MLKMKDTKKIELLLKVLMVFALFASTLLAFYTLHDVQTAHGAGLYLSMVFLQSSRTPFDLGVDLVGILLFLLVLSFPMFFNKTKGLPCFFRFFAVYLAFMPVVDPGQVVHLPEAFTHIHLRESLQTGNWGSFFFTDLTPVFELCKFLLPFLILLWALVNNLPNKPKKSFLPLFLSLGMLFCFCLFGNVADTFFYFACYFLILMCFQFWEVLCRESSAFAAWSNVLFYGCLLRGIYRMLVLVSMSHM